MKKLTKNFSDRILCGVCGGIAKYLDVDSAIIRFIVCIGSLCTEWMIISYIIACFILPDDENYDDTGYGAVA